MFEGLQMKTCKGIIGLLPERRGRFVARSWPLRGYVYLLGSRVSDSMLSRLDIC